jgi:hypothetical protein
MGITTLGRRTGTAGDERQNVRSAHVALGRFSFGWSRFLAASQAATLVRSIRWIFLARGRFAPKAPLLSVAFPCSDRDFSMGYAA